MRSKTAIYFATVLIFSQYPSSSFAQFGMGFDPGQFAGDNVNGLVPIPVDEDIITDQTIYPDDELLEGSELAQALLPYAFLLLVPNADEAQDLLTGPLPVIRARRTPEDFDIYAVWSNEIRLTVDVHSQQVEAAGGGFGEPGVAVGSLNDLFEVVDAGNQFVRGTGDCGATGQAAENVTLVYASITYDADGNVTSEVEVEETTLANGAKQTVQQQGENLITIRTEPENLLVTVFGEDGWQVQQRLLENFFTGVNTEPYATRVTEFPPGSEPVIGRSCFSVGDILFLDADRGTSTTTNAGQTPQTVDFTTIAQIKVVTDTDLLVDTPEGPQYINRELVLLPEGFVINETFSNSDENNPWLRNRTNKSVYYPFDDFGPSSSSSFNLIR